MARGDHSALTPHPMRTPHCTLYIGWAQDSCCIIQRGIALKPIISWEYSFLHLSAREKYRSCRWEIAAGNLALDYFHVELGWRQVETANRKEPPSYTAAVTSDILLPPMARTVHFAECQNRRRNDLVFTLPPITIFYVYAI